MRSSTLTPRAQRTAALRVVSFIASCLCILVLMLLPAITANAHSTTTVQVGCTPNAAVPQVDSGYTIPRGAIVLTGTATSATGLPVRHLWVGDNILGFCRIDPDLDTPGIK